MARGNRTAKVRRGVVALFAALLLGLAMMPAGANAAKIDNPSPPNFRMEVTGGFLELIGTKGLALGIEIDMSKLESDSPLPNPALVGTVTTGANGYGDITIPNAEYGNGNCVPSQSPPGGGMCFPPIPIVAEGTNASAKISPVGVTTGKIDPLSGLVTLNIPLRIQVTGSVMSTGVGNTCFIGSSGNPLLLRLQSFAGTFPTTTPAPDLPLAVADFTQNTAGYLSGQGYSDEAGVWPSYPLPVPGYTPGVTGKPAASLIPVNPLTDVKPRAAGSFRGVDETWTAPAASGCSGLDSIVNDTAIGLPSGPPNNTASLDFKFTTFPARPDVANSIVNRAVRSNFVATGISASPWLNTQIPTAVSSQGVTINASSSYFKAGPHPSQTYAFDLGTGSFGAPTTNPVANFTAPFIASGGNPVNMTIRVRATDADGDTNVSTRTLRVVPATDITLATEIDSPAGTGKLRAGSSGTVKFRVGNSSATDSSSQSIAFNAALPAGVSITSLNSPGAWTCSNNASTISCSLPQGGLGAGQTATFEAAVDVAANAASPGNVTASAVMTGDPAPANNQINQNVTIAKTDLRVVTSHTANLVANGWLPYSVEVTNLGDSPTVGGSSVSVTLPSDFAYRSQGSGGSGWSCVPANPQSINCSRGSEIAANSSAPTITIWARIDRNTPAENRTVTAQVTTQADLDAFGGANSSSDTALVQVATDLAAGVSVNGAFTVGTPDEITYTVTNESVVPTSNPVTISSALPSGLTVNSVAGSGWDCTATVPGSGQISCVYSATLAGGNQAPPVVAQVAVAQEAYPSVTVPVGLTNTGDAFGLNDNAEVAVQIKRLDVSLEKIAVKPFNVGIEGRYRLNVTNIGEAPTVGAITVTDTLPAGLKLKGVSGAGWDCSDSTVGGSDVTCVMADPLGGGVQAAPIEIRVDVLDEAAEAGTVVNTAYVDTARDTRGVTADDAVTANNTASVSTTAVAVDLSIESRHQGAFRVGTEDVYSLDIRNIGFFGTDPGEAITVTDDLPEGIVPIVDDIEVTRPGWTCDEEDGDVTCVLQAPDALSSAMEPETSVTIDIPVQITDAAADTSNNVAEVSTARDSNPALSPNNIATDATQVTRIDLAASGAVSIPPRAGGIGQMDISVHNGGSHATVNPLTVVMPLATGVSYRPSGSTTAGWSCSSAGVATDVTCVRSQNLAAGGDTPPLKLRTNVGANAPATWNTVLSVSSVGEPSTRLTDNEATVAQSLETIDLSIAKSHNSADVRSGKRGSFKIHVQNVGNTATAASYRVQDSVNSTFQNVSASGPGWTCSVTGNNVDCTRTVSVGAGLSAPDITVGFDIPGSASGTKNSVATVSSTDDPFTGNNSAGDPISIVATADVKVVIDQPNSLRIGDEVSIGYDVINVGAASTAGAPSVKLSIGSSSGLEPIGSEADGDWSCDPVPSSPGHDARLDCEYSGSLEPGATSTVYGKFQVVATSNSSIDSYAHVSTPGEVNLFNNLALSSSSLSGVDLEATVTATGDFPDFMVAGSTARRVVSVENVGSSATTGPVRVSVDLPVGVQWDSSVAAGSGWVCSQTARVVNCQRSDQYAAGQSLPNLTFGLRPSKSNAPAVAINYVVSTTGDENLENDVASRTDEVRYNPDTVITAGPSNGTSKSGSVTFNSPDPDVTFQCQVDSAPFAACTSPFGFQGLSIGQHSVSVRAVNEHGMEDLTPATVSWQIAPLAKTGPTVPVKMKSTDGTLSLASLGSVPLPPDQVELNGVIYTDGGGVTIPKENVAFKPVEQVIPEALNGADVGVKISITATADGDGTLPTGGGPASLVLPVRADVTATLNGTPLLPEGTECALAPITFDLNGTYDENAKSVHLEQPNVAFPKVTGCGILKSQVDGLLELPRNDIQMSLDFSVEKGAATCVPPQVGTPPNCQNPVTDVVKLEQVVVKGPKKVKGGKKLTFRALVKNSGTAVAENVKVCAQTPKRLVAGKASRCVTIKSIAAGATGVAKFTVKTKKAAKKAAAKITVSAPMTKDGSQGLATGKRIYKPVVTR